MNTGSNNIARINHIFIASTICKTQNALYTNIKTKGVYDFQYSKAQVNKSKRKDPIAHFEIDFRQAIFKY